MFILDIKGWTIRKVMGGGGGGGNKNNHARKKDKTKNLCKEGKEIKSIHVHLAATKVLHR